MIGSVLFPVRLLVAVLCAVEDEYIRAWHEDDEPEERQYRWCESHWRKLPKPPNRRVAGRRGR